MISNARIESDAISSARDTPKMMASTERPDYPHHHHSHSHSHSLVHPRSQAALSDGEGAPYEDELERRRGPAMDRGSV